jgi:hypothetical protein
VAGLDHSLHPLRQRVAGPLLRLPVCALVLVDLDLLASSLMFCITPELYAALKRTGLGPRAAARAS